MQMKGPHHPGKVLYETYISPLSLTIAHVAKTLGITRQTLSEIVNEHRGITVEMAMRLGKAFNTAPHRWLVLQNEYELWKLRKKNLSKIACLVKKKAKK